MRLGALILATMIAATWAPLPAAGQIQPRPDTIPSTRVLDCTTSGCHAKQITHKFLHGPTAIQECNACHEYADPALHTFDMKRPGRQLCDFCHIDKTGREGPVVHDPVAKGDCLACHDPHGAGNRKMLKKDSTPQLCADCHKETLSGANVHAPAGEDCSKCHLPHTSTHKGLLISEKRALCVSCHAEVGTAILASAHPHEPAAVTGEKAGDCLQCHAPHASDHIKALKQSPAELCASCHQETALHASQASRPHTAVSDTRACLNCHTAHASDHVKMLASDPVASCLACHSKPIEVGKERTIAAVPEVAAEALFKHGPIEKEAATSGGCASCHDVHGGEQAGLLIKPYSAQFYQPYSDEAYALCLKCHDKQAIVAQPALALTGFRDGSRNLHAVHVTEDPRGRNCRSCHTPHASRFRAQIADTVGFGQWKLPINFKPTETGGSCAPGCHTAKTYVRGPVDTPGAVKEPGGSP